MQREGNVRETSITINSTVWALPTTEWSLVGSSAMLCFVGFFLFSRVVNSFSYACDWNMSNNSEKKQYLESPVNLPTPFWFIPWLYKCYCHVTLRDLINLHCFWKGTICTPFNWKWVLHKMHNKICFCCWSFPFREQQWCASSKYP